jgi:hypothetical protein
VAVALLSAELLPLFLDRRSESLLLAGAGRGGGGRPACQALLMQTAVMAKVIMPAMHTKISMQIWSTKAGVMELAWSLRTISCV